MRARTGTKNTYDFTRSQVGTSPCGGVSGATVVTLPSDAVCKLGRGIVSVTDQIIGLRLVALRLVRGPKVLHGAGGDLVGSGGVRIGGRVRLGVSRAVVVWRGRLVVETVSFGGSVTCLHYDLIWVRGRGIKVPLGLLRELGREKRCEKER